MAGENEFEIQNRAAEVFRGPRRRPKTASSIFCDFRYFFSIFSARAEQNHLLGPELCADALREGVDCCEKLAGGRRAKAIDPARTVVGRLQSHMTTDLIQRRNRALGAGAPLFYREPLHLVRGEGAYLFDADGRRYLDLYNNVPCVGHAHPRIVEAMATQQATLNVHSRYLHEAILELAERITGLHGERLESVVFSCTGTEANEVALRMARAATGRRGIVCSDAAYHGTSEAVGKLTHVGRRNPERGAEVRGFPFPQTYRPLADGPLDQLRDRYLDRLQAAIDDLTNDGVGFAGLLVCPIFANEGLPTVPAGFMPRAAQMHARRAEWSSPTRSRPAIAAPVGGGATRLRDSSPTSW